jgi:hypothetical protein
MGSQTAMPKLLPDDLLERVTNALAADPRGLSLAELQSRQQYPAPLDALSTVNAAVRSYWMDCLLLAQRCEHVRYRTRNQIRTHRGASREPRKFFSKQSTDFRKRNPGTVRQRGDRPLVPYGLLAILQLRDHEGLFFATETPSFVTVGGP